MIEWPATGNTAGLACWMDFGLDFVVSTLWILSSFLSFGSIFREKANQLTRSGLDLRFSFFLFLGSNLSN
jgi:hypothetical protein